MSTRVHSNIGHTMDRQLPQAFSGNAIGTTNPNTLHSNKPTHLDAMGRAGASGTFTFGTDDSGNQAYTVFFWSEMVNQQDPTNGWIYAGASAAEYTKSADAHAAITFTVPENAYIFIMAGTRACPNCWAGGLRRCDFQAADIRGSN